MHRATKIKRLGKQAAARESLVLQAPDHLGQMELRCPAKRAVKLARRRQSTALLRLLMLRLLGSPNSVARTIRPGKALFRDCPQPCILESRPTMIGKQMFTMTSCLMPSSTGMRTGPRLISARSAMRSRNLLWLHGYSRTCLGLSPPCSGPTLLSHWLRDWTSWLHAPCGTSH